MKIKLYRCPRCGNIVTMLHDTGVVPHCCGTAMEELLPKSEDMGNEKHLPVVKVEGNKVHVEVGSVLHPMTVEHSIQFVILETNKGFKVNKCHETPITDFVLGEDEEALAVYEYCNLHGLWKTELTK